MWSKKHSGQSSVTKRYRWVEEGVILSFEQYSIFIVSQLCGKAGKGVLQQTDWLVDWFSTVHVGVWGVRTITCVDIVRSYIRRRRGGWCNNVSSAKKRGKEKPYSTRVSAQEAPEWMCAWWWVAAGKVSRELGWMNSMGGHNGKCIQWTVNNEQAIEIWKNEVNVHLFELEQMDGCYLQTDALWCFELTMQLYLVIRIWWRK